MKTATPAPPIHRVESIAHLHQFAGLGPPYHPLVSVVDFAEVDAAAIEGEQSFACAFYSINFKRVCRLRYGRQDFDHQDGTLLCTGPGQVLTYDPQDAVSGTTAGWGLFFHPDFVKNSDLASLLGECSFFQYSESEALHLSEELRRALQGLVDNIAMECRLPDAYASEIISGSLALLLRYCQRAYGAQLSRRSRHGDLLVRFERHLQRLSEAKPAALPTVRECAEAMGLSTNYFSDLIRQETGKTPQEHIHQVQLDRAKILLSTSTRTIAEIAYELGFEYPQSFSKLFRRKFGSSPLAFRDRLREPAAPDPDRAS